MRPQANLLLTLGGQAIAIGYVAHIANDQRADIALLGPGDHGRLTFVLHVSGRRFCFARKRFLRRCSRFQAPGPLRLRACLVRSSERRLAVYCWFARIARQVIMTVSCAIGDGSRVDLAKVDRLPYPSR